MRNKHLLPLLALLLAQSLNAQTNPGRVLVIGIDGCRADALRAANAPNIHGLLDNAVYSFDALTQFPTWSGAGWSSMCTGVWEDKHGVLDNSFVGSNYAQYPHFIQRTEAHDPSLHTASIVHWAPINTQINTLCDIEINVPTDLEVKTSAVSYLTDNDPDILFVAFDDVDHAGHGYGFAPEIPEYMATIELTDGYVGEIMDALLDRPNFMEENWLVLLTTDHGGNLAGHGGASFEERNIFFIAWQQGLAPQEITKESTVFSLGSGLQFNGSDQYLLPNDSSPFEFGDSQDFSIEMRVRYTSLAGDAAFVSNKDWDSGMNPGWVISTPTGNTANWKVNIADGTTRKDVTGGMVGDGNWHHLAVTFDRDGAMKLYEDGNAIGEANISAIGNVDAGFPLVIGQDGTLEYPYFFNGSIAELRIWNTVLAPETVAAYTCSPLNASHPNQANLVGYWKMDEGAGSTIGNAVANSPNLNLVGSAPVWSSQPGSLVCEDFTHTPRIVDVAVTALTHLCVPIDSAWQLDGHSHVPECLPISGLAETNDADWLKMTPNPAQETLRIECTPASLTSPMTVELLSTHGQVLRTYFMRENELQISLQGLTAGLHFVKVVGAERSGLLKLVVVN